MEIYVTKEQYNRQKQEYLILPKPSVLYNISVDDIEKFYIEYFSQLNQFPLYIHVEWYDDDYDGMVKILEKAGVSYNHQYIPQERAFRLTENGDVYFDILIFSVEVRTKEQLAEVVEETLLPYHLFIITNQKNIIFGEKYYQEDSIQITMDKNDTTTCIKEYDIHSTYFLSTQFANLSSLMGSFPKYMTVTMDEQDDDLVD